MYLMILGSAMELTVMETVMDSVGLRLVHYCFFKERRTKNERSTLLVF